MDTTPDPQHEYSLRLAQHQALRQTAETSSSKYWQARRIVFVIGAILLLLSFPGWLTAGWVMLPVVVFIALLVRHQAVQEQIEWQTSAIRYYEYCLARLSDTWMGKGNAGDRFKQAEHPYAEDLDIFGTGSLFELLCTARTRAGEERLAQWLLAPAGAETIQTRQAALADLSQRISLRADLALLEETTEQRNRAGVHHAELIAWATQPATFTSASLRMASVVIGLLALSCLVIWFAYGLGWLAFGGLLLVSGVYAYTRQDVSRIISGVEHPSRDLRLLSQVLARVEQEQFNAPALQQLRATLASDGQPPSQQIAALQRMCEWLDWSKNQFFAPFAFLFLVPVQISISIERWKATSGPLVPGWLEALAEFEALNSLAGYAYEHPHDPFPVIVTGPALFEAQQLGHPLIPESKCIHNDVTLNSTQQLLIVSGSNMSGKSTLMRTVGINTVLALAGAPVRAQSLRLARVNLGAAIHVQDSLQAGASRFYAEITRLRQVVELTQADLPLLFLLDEILSGTNSHDRRIGAAAVIKGLVERGALGLVTTHDLALTKIADELADRAVNVHFEDELRNGRMHFDYHMRPGVVQRSNALELMRAVGLEV